jgi:CheY-like chemotaxis protein
MATVLIVEDEEHLRATLGYNLRKAGYDVQSAASGPEALARCSLCCSTPAASGYRC